MGTIHKRHTCDKCRVKRVEYKMYKIGRSLMNGKPIWICKNKLICDFHAPGADDTSS